MTNNNVWPSNVCVWNDAPWDELWRMRGFQTIICPKKEGRAENCELMCLNEDAPVQKKWKKWKQNNDCDVNDAR